MKLWYELIITCIPLILIFVIIVMIERVENIIEVILLLGLALSLVLYVMKTYDSKEEKKYE